MIIHILEIMFLTWESLEDLKCQKLSVYSLGLFMTLGFAVRIFYQKTSIREIIIGMTVGLIVILIAKLTGEAIGYGDGMVILITGIYSGMKMTVCTLFLAFLVMMAVAAVLIWRRGFHYNARLPFVPCILLGYIGGLVI